MTDDKLDAIEARANAAKKWPNESPLTVADDALWLVGRARDLEQAARMGLSRLTLARATMRAFLKSRDAANLEAWLLTCDENEWLGEISAALAASGEEQNG